MTVIGDLIYDLLSNIYVLGLTCRNISKNVFSIKFTGGAF